LALGFACLHTRAAAGLIARAAVVALSALRWFGHARRGLVHVRGPIAARLGFLDALPFGIALPWAPPAAAFSVAGSIATIHLLASRRRSIIRSTQLRRVVNVVL
jgi:hypothetical protein